ncbi:MAG: protein phosphatase 2C domain-containing protein [Pseudonocardiaceae bacterium]
MTLEVALTVLFAIAIGVIAYLTVQLNRAGRALPDAPLHAAPAPPIPPPVAEAIIGIQEKVSYRGASVGLIPVPEMVGTPGGLRPVEPAGLPGGHDVVPDSVVDGANLGSLTVRAASVRGDHHRQEPNFRRDAYTIQPLTGGFAVPNLVSVVAAGNPNGSVAQTGAALACRSVVTQLGKLGGSIDAAWNGQPSIDLRELLRPVCNGVANRLTELAQSRQVPEAESSVELVCLVSQLGDTSERRHLAFGIGGGVVLRCTDQGWQLVFSAQEGPGKPEVLPGGHQALRVGMVESRPDDILLVASQATAQVVTSRDSGAFFAGQWRQGPRDLVEFLWQFSARTPGTARDRTAVCLWDSGRALT